MPQRCNKKEIVKAEPEIGTENCSDDEGTGKGKVKSEEKA